MKLKNNKLQNQNIIFDEKNNGTIFPIGAIKICSINATDTDSFFICDGRDLDKNVYLELFSIIKYNFGRNGDNFRIPDLRGRFIRAQTTSSLIDPYVNSRTSIYDGNSSGIGSYIDYKTAKPVNTNISGNSTTNGSHSSHDYWKSTSVVDKDTGGGGYSNFYYDTDFPGNYFYSTYAGSHTHTFSITGGSNLESAPKNAYVDFMIRYI